ncbi:MAG: hypothetical protein ABEL76_06690 [Bradymonadaceae bacterium]
MDEPDDPELERHRPFVRDLDKQVRSLYGFGGAAILAAIAGSLALWGGYGTLWTWWAWATAVVVALGGLLVLRTVVIHRAQTLVRQFRTYCETNDLEPEAIRAYFTRDDMYPYFEGLFELLDRHRELRAGADSDE